MPGEAGPQLRAWVDYFRDLGVHDFYRRGEPGIAIADESDVGASELSEANALPAEIAQAAAVEEIPANQFDSPFAFDTHAHSAESAGVAVPPPMKLVSFNELAPRPASTIPAAERAAALRAIQEEIGDCTRCPLAYGGRRKIVFGDGSPTARLIFVGEGPGADEDAQGVPFVGKAGQLLNNMIAAMGLTREEVYIANIVKCRPPSNRVPEPVEANTCSQFLVRQIDVVRPEVIVALGSTAATYLLGVKQSLSGLRGRWHSCCGAKLAVTYHPAFLLRDPRQKAEAWKDLQMVMAEMGLKPPAKK
jgi:uracil-DNA glycosylase family 4